MAIATRKDEPVWRAIEPRRALRKRALWASGRENKGERVMQENQWPGSSPTPPGDGSGEHGQSWQFGPGAPPPPRWDEPVRDEPGRTGPSWEHWREIGFFRAWMATIGEVLTRPTATFATMKREGGLGNPIGFYVLTGWAVVVASSLMNAPFLLMRSDKQLEQFVRQYNLPPELLNGLGSMVGMTIGCILAPIFLLIGIFISAAILHVMLLVLGGARQEFETTLRVAAYAQGACSVLGLIPLCGGPIVLVASIVAMTIGLAQAHETDTWRALVAVLLPKALMLICCCGLFFLFLGMIGAAVAQH
jgi:hypothetical protein